MKLRTPDWTGGASSVLCIGLCAGCAVDADLAAAGDQEAAIGEIEAPGPGSEVAECGLLPFAPSNFDPCAVGPVSPPLEMDILTDFPCATYGINTDTGALFVPCEPVSTVAGVVVEQDGGPDLFVVTTSSFTLGEQSILRILGSRALVIVSTGDITIEGDFRASADEQLSRAGGDHPESCGTGGRGRNGVTQRKAGAVSAGTGGGGGGFGASGGAGGEVDDAENAVPVPGGQATGNTILVPLRGGCAGGRGGKPGNLPFSEGGGAGGAVQLVAGGHLFVAGGSVTLGGGGGDNVLFQGGGAGGGGAGGGLLLEASTITIDGELSANGGGGGEGSLFEGWTTPGHVGNQGAQRAPGGSGSGDGGDGGGGGALVGDDGLTGLPGISTATKLAGSGGGGGSVGRIHLRAIAAPPEISPDALISPAPQ